jgi:hypothetical protein
MKDLLLVLAGLAVVSGGCARSARRSAGGLTERQDLSAEVQATPAEARPRLESHGFAVLDFRVRRDEYRRVVILGEIRNVAESAKAVELRATLRDAQGRLLAVGNFYPASRTNIQPGDTWPFAYSFGREDEAVEAHLRIVGTFRAIDVSHLAHLIP